MGKEFDKKGWASGFTVAVFTAIWVASSVITLAQSGLVA